MCSGRAGQELPTVPTGTAPAPCTHSRARIDFKNGLKGKEKGLSFHQPIPLSLHPSPAWFPVLAGPNPITPLPHITTPNTRSEDSPSAATVGAATLQPECPAKPVEAPAFLPWGITRSKEETLPVDPHPAQLVPAVPLNAPPAKPLPCRSRSRERQRGAGWGRGSGFLQL